MSGATKTETHETVWDGALSGAEFKTLVLDALRRSDLPGIGYHGLALELTIGSTLMATKFPDVRYKVTRDELWMMKPDAED